MPQALAGIRGNAVSAAGIVIENAEIEVFVAGSNDQKPDLFEDRNGNTPLTNPFTTGNDGFFEFFCTGGAYRIEARAEGAERLWNGDLIGTAQGLDADDIVSPGDLATVATTGDHADLSNIGTNTHAQIDSHIASTANPHGVTKSQVGLGDVDNVSAADLRDRATHTGTQAISTVSGLQSALDAKAAIANLGAAAFSNDHQDLTGAGTNTHGQIDSHIANDAIHREINDLGTGATDLWSAEKILAELSDVEVGAVSVQPRLTGNGSSASPLDIASGAINRNRLSSEVEGNVYPEHALVRLTEDGGLELGALTNRVLFNDASAEFLATSRISISDGVITFSQNGVYKVDVVINAQAEFPASGSFEIVTTPGGTATQVAFVSAGELTDQRKQFVMTAHVTVPVSVTRTMAVRLTCGAGSQFTNLQGSTISITRIRNP